MNPLLLVVALLFMFLRNRNGNLSDLLKEVDINDALSLLKTLGVNDGAMNSLSELINQVAAGKTDVMSLIKSALPLILSLSQKSGNAYSGQNESNGRDYTGEGLSPICDFAPQMVTEGLKNYFE